MQYYFGPMNHPGNLGIPKLMYVLIRLVILEVITVESRYMLQKILMKELMFKNISSYSKDHQRLHLNFKC